MIVAQTYTVNLSNIAIKPENIFDALREFEFVTFILSVRVHTYDLL